MCASLYLSCMYAYTPHDRTSPYTRVPPVAPHHLLYLHFMRQKHPSSMFHIPPSPSKSSSSPRCNRNWDPDPYDVFSVTLSSDSPLPLPSGHSARKSKIQTSQFTAHFLVPSFLLGAQKSDYAPAKQQLRRHTHRLSGKGKALQKTIPVRMN